MRGFCGSSVGMTQTVESLFRDQAEADERSSCRLVLRLALADAFSTSHLLAIPDDVEDPEAAVIRPRNANVAVLRQRQSPRLGDLLQRGLGVGQGKGPVVEVFQIIGELAVDEIERRLPTAIENDCADHRFEEIFEEGRSFPAPREFLTRSEDHPTIEAEKSGPFGKPFRAHKMDALAGQHPLIVFRKLLEEDLRHSMPDHGIAEELEPLIGASLLRRQSRPVSQRSLQQISILESMIEEFLERGKSVVFVRCHACIVQIED